jgi:uncharacterized protein YjiS (DUF1127 family)
MNTAANRKTREPTPQPVLGIVKTTYPRIDTTRPAVNDADYSGAAELDLWARRTFAANGFGDAGVHETSPATHDFAGDPRATAPAARASFRQICVAIGEAIAAGLGRLAVRWREYRALRRTYKALADLDERTLKDIGFGPHEAGSIAAELAGRAERTRTQALRTLRYLSI